MKFADLMEAHAEELAALESLDNGKVRRSFTFFLTLLLFILPQPKWALMGRKPGSNKQAAQHSGCSARRPTTLAAPA